MDIIPRDCRLCLDQFAENAQSMDSPELKQQLEKVFYFAIELKEGFSTSVCQSCSYTISEFYRYAEEVRKNQECLCGENQLKQIIHSEITIEDVKTELSGPDHDQSIILETEQGTNCDAFIRDTTNSTKEPDDGIMFKSCKSVQRHDLKQEHEESNTSEHRPRSLLKANSSSLSSYPNKVCQVSRNLMISETRVRAIQKRTKSKKKVVEQKRQCSKCQKWLKNADKLQIHIDKTHTDRNAHFCSICENYYPHYLSLQRHRKAVHTEATFECEFCGKKFKRRRNLMEHRTTHTGEVLYSCDFCDMTMNFQAHFYKHIKYHHPVEWEAKKRKASEAKV